MVETQRNAVAILRAARFRRRGYRAWDLPAARLALLAPSQHFLGWYAFTYERHGKGRRGLNLGQWRDEAKRVAREFLA